MIGNSSCPINNKKQLIRNKTNKIIYKLSHKNQNFSFLWGTHGTINLVTYIMLDTSNIIKSYVCIHTDTYIHTLIHTHSYKEQ